MKLHGHAGKFEANQITTSEKAGHVPGKEKPS